MYLSFALTSVRNCCKQVYRSSHPGMAVRVYHMVYANSCEEHRYLAAIRKEKEAFERLVKERGVSTSA